MTTYYKRGDRFPDVYVGKKKTVSLMFRDQMDEGEGITTAAWSSVPSDLSFSGQSHAGRVAGATVSGGIANTEYVVLCDVVTDQGQEIHAEKKMLFKPVSA